MTLDSAPVRWSGDVGKQQSHQSGAGVRLHPAVKRRGLSLQRKEHRQGLEAPRQAVQLVRVMVRGRQSWGMGVW